MSPEAESGLSVLQALVIAGDATMVNTILQLSPSNLDICIALITTRTLDLLSQRLRSLVHYETSRNALPVSNSSHLQRALKNKDANSYSITLLLHNVVKRFQNSSLLREVVSKGNLSQLFKILSCSASFRENRKSHLGKTNCHGTTLLMSACWSGKAEVVDYLLSNGARVHDRDVKHRTALHFAASNNCIDVLKLLLGAGACLNDEDWDGLTPLHCAAQSDRTETVNFLIDKGGDANRPTRATGRNDFERATPLHFAAQNGHNDTVKVLLEKGAKVDSVTSKGVTSLMLASEKGHVGIVQLLLSEGSDINVADVSGKTALEFAVLKDQLSVVKRLIDEGIALRAFIGSNFFERLLLAAVKRGNRDLLESLILAEDKTQIILQEIHLSPWDKTLLHVASETKGNAAVVDLLAKLFSHVNVITSRGQTPLHFAVDVRIARQLVEAGANVNLM